MTDNISAAAAAAYRGKTVVVKYGGNAIADPELQRAVIDDIAFLHGAGVRVILVHGGGSEINAMLGRVGIEPRFVDGLRYTDPDTMEIVQMVLCGKINKQLAAQLSGRGAKALGLSPETSIKTGIIGPTDTTNGYVYALYNRGIVGGDSSSGKNLYNPNSTLLRDEMAKIVCGVMDNAK